MSGASKTEPGGAADATLRPTVERILARAQGHPVRVSDLKLQHSPFATLFPADVVSVLLESGEQISLFVKYLGLEQSDHPDKQVRDRELQIYEKLLGKSDLPVSRYYGSRWNGATTRYELFLEYIDDWNLKYHELE